MRLLIVDDDRDLTDLLTFWLRRSDFEVATAAEISRARALLAGEPFDLIVLDIGLGARNGLELLPEIRRAGMAKVILLTGRGSEDERVMGFDLGADDYVVKPFSHRELVARIRAHLRGPQGRHSHAVAAEPLQEGPLVLIPALHHATMEGRPVRLTGMEFRLLYYLMHNAGVALRRETIRQEIWGTRYSSTPDVVRVTVYRLRGKIERDPKHPAILHTVDGVGFMLRWQPPEEQAPGT